MGGFSPTCARSPPPHPASAASVSAGPPPRCAQRTALRRGPSSFTHLYAPVPCQTDPSRPKQMSREQGGQTTPFSHDIPAMSREPRGQGARTPQPAMNITLQERRTGLAQQRSWTTPRFPIASTSHQISRGRPSSQPRAVLPRGDHLMRWSVVHKCWVRRTHRAATPLHNIRVPPAQRLHTRRSPHV